MIGKINIFAPNQHSVIILLSKVPMLSSVLVVFTVTLGDLE